MKSSPEDNATGRSTRPRLQWMDLLPVMAAMFVVTWVYLGPIHAMPSRVSQTPIDYYGYLTEAFYSGQLHLNLKADPVLLSLENPYAGPQGASRPHDMSYYQGRFYLYYGATPVLLVYLPWRLITGTYLHESIGSVLMLNAGFLLAALWLTQAWRRWFYRLSPWWPALLILSIGLSPPLLTGARNITFYAVPINGAVFCLMLAITAADRALAVRTSEAQAAWLATASLFWGLAVGARPVYVMGLTVLAVPAFWLWWQAGRESRWRWSALRPLVAAVTPAAVVGAALMTYNYLRFDDPFDFGIRFSLAWGDIREAKLVGPEFISKNLNLYLLQPAAFVRYFPFIITGGAPYGVLPHLPLVALAALFPLACFFNRPASSHWVLNSFLLLGAAAANLGLLSLFFGHDERYLLDFAPPLLLLGAVTALTLLDSSRHGRIRWLTGGLVLALSGYTMTGGILLDLSRSAESPDRLKLERLLNWPAHAWEQSTGTIHGPLELSVMFPQDRTGRTEPLVTTGYGRDGGDLVTVHYPDESHVQFGAFHIGRGGPVSEPIRIDYREPHQLRITLGSLYPPTGHPLFADWTPSQAASVRRQLRIELDGRTVLRGRFTVHASSPANLSVGSNPLARDVADATFTGRILTEKRSGVDLADVAAYDGRPGPVRLTVRFPKRVGEEGLPLVATGSRDQGDLIFAQLLEGNRIRFGHDSFGGGAIYSASTPFDPTQDQTIDIAMGSLYPTGTGNHPAPERHRLRIALNGVAQLDTARWFNPSTTEQVEFGSNPIRASTAIDYFPGTIRKVEPQPRPPGASDRDWGYLRLVVVFSPFASSIAEPLVVTGHTGRADLLFVRYEPDGRVRFGLDHWGLGAVLSEPVTLDRKQTHLIEVLSGALLPPERHEAWTGHDPAEASRRRDRIEVRLNGQTIFTPAFVPYSNESGEFSIGRNDIGASTCEPLFSGQFLLIERTPW